MLSLSEGDPKFLGLKTIQNNFSEALGFEFPIYNNIKDTAYHAVIKANSKLDYKNLDDNI